MIIKMRSINILHEPSLCVIVNIFIQLNLKSKQLSVYMKDFVIGSFNDMT